LWSTQRLWMACRPPAWLTIRLARRTSGRSIHTTDPEFTDTPFRAVSRARVTGTRDEQVLKRVTHRNGLRAKCNQCNRIEHCRYRHRVVRWYRRVRVVREARISRYATDPRMAHPIVRVILALSLSTAVFLTGVNDAAAAGPPTPSTPAVSKTAAPTSSAAPASRRQVLAVEVKPADLMGAIARQLAQPEAWQEECPYWHVQGNGHE
jgi:hypothetical protein